MVAWLATSRHQQPVECFFCRSPAPVSARDTAWVCAACGEAHSPRRMAGLIDPSMSSAPTPAAEPKAWLRPSTQPSPFCATCLRNHQIVSALLADFDPPEADPELAHQAAATYRAQLEAGYPPVCPACAPRVQQVIADNTRRAKTAMYASALQRPDRPAPLPAAGMHLLLLSWARMTVQILPLLLTLVWLAGIPRPALGDIDTQGFPLTLLLAAQYFAVLAGPGRSRRRYLAASAALVQTALLLSPRALQLYTKWVSSNTFWSYASNMSTQPVSAWRSDPSSLPAGLQWVLVAAAVVQLWAVLSPIEAPVPPPEAVLVLHQPAPAEPVAPPPVPSDPLLSSWGLSPEQPAAPVPEEADDTMDWEPETAVRRRRPEPVVRPQTYFPPGTLQAQQTGLEDMFGRAVALQDPPLPAPTPRYPSALLLAVAAAAVLFTLVPVLVARKE